jgi:predicted dehydrogenase
LFSKINMMKKIRWGILGCGRIAGKFASDLQYVEDAELAAVGSRELEKARSFAADYFVPKAYGSYEALVADPDLDVIYVASPHAQHHEHSLLCLRHDKAVLCEKAFALNLHQVKEMVAASKERGVFLMEALWTRFLPHYQLLMHHVHSGKLGSIRSVLINFGFKPTEPIPQRLFDPALGGGSLLDIGIYNVFMALSVLGRPDEIEAWMTPASTGVDEQCAMTFRYVSGAMAQLFSSFAVHLATEADISGTAGRIRLGSRFYEPSTEIFYYPERMDSATPLAFEKTPGWGYHYQVRHVHECLRQGLTESPIMSHSESVLLMETLDRVRKKAGIVYPADSTV